MEHNLWHAYNTVSLETLEELNYAQEYISHLAWNINFIDSNRFNDTNTPWLYCNKIETCSERIIKDIPEANNYNIVQELIQYIFINIDVSKFTNYVAKEYVDFLFGKVKRYKLKTPHEFCEMPSKNLFKKKNTKSTKSIICIKEIQDCGFLEHESDWNFQYAFFNVSLNTVHNRKHANDYFNYLLTQIKWDALYSAFDHSYTTYSYCVSIGKDFFRDPDLEFGIGLYKGT